MIVLYLTIGGTECSIAQDNEVTSFQNEEFDYLNIRLNGKVNHLTQTSHNLNSNYLDTTAYVFNINWQPEEITINSLEIDVQTSDTIIEKSIFNFTNGKIISAIKERFPETENDFLYTFDNKYEYDENGNLIVKRSYMRNCLVSESLYDYDDENRVLKNTEYIYGYFNRKNKEIIPENKSEYLSMVYTYQYDSVGNLVIETMDNIKGDIHKKYIYKYDSLGNMIEDGWIQSYTKNKSKNSYEPLMGYEYNENGKLVKKYCIGKFSPHNTDTYYQYDEKGNEIDVKGYYIANDTVLGYHFVYEYDKQGNQIKEEEKVGNYRRLGFEKYKSLKTQYDGYGNITNQEYIRGDGEFLKKIRYKYTYDSFGNWTMREKYESNFGQSLTKTEIDKRRIQYYKE